MVMMHIESIQRAASKQRVRLRLQQRSMLSGRSFRVESAARLLQQSASMRSSHLLQRHAAERGALPRRSAAACAALAPGSESTAASDDDRCSSGNARRVRNQVALGRHAA
jgi:hypothetical protein